MRRITTFIPSTGGVDVDDCVNYSDDVNYSTQSSISAKTNMDVFQTIVPLIGVALCGMALLQLALWSAQSLSLITQNRKQFELSRQRLREQMELKSPRSEPTPQLQVGSWAGYRSFRVARMVKETEVCTSVYLQPVDAKPIATFRPGQHLTFRFQIPGQTKPVVRCYSLSDGPDKDYYRISVKTVPAPRDRPELPAGRASQFINQGLKEGDQVDVKAPAGHFMLDESNLAPVVMLAGGIGVTPMVSMADYLTRRSDRRLILLVYGVRNAADHAFKNYFASLATEHPNFHVLNCYSDPQPQDQEGIDYQVHGFASVELLQKLLPNNLAQFYLCGPPPFMQSLYRGLMDWGVPESRVCFEAFGPASIQKTKPVATNAESTIKPAVVNFTGSAVTAEWDDRFDSLLELAEAHDVPIESGCRAGSCGTCATDIVSGEVSYPDAAPECEPGQCLMCIARPQGPLELDI